MNDSTKLLHKSFSSYLSIYLYVRKRVKALHGIKTFKYFSISPNIHVNYTDLQVQLSSPFTVLI